MPKGHLRSEQRLPSQGRPSLSPGLLSERAVLFIPLPITSCPGPLQPFVGEAGGPLHRWMHTCMHTMVSQESLQNVFKFEINSRVWHGRVGFREGHDPDHTVPWSPAFSRRFSASH